MAGGPILPDQVGLYEFSAKYVEMLDRSGCWAQRPEPVSAHAPYLSLITKQRAYLLAETFFGECSVSVEREVKPLRSWPLHPS